MSEQPYWNKRQDGTDIPARTLKILDSRRGLRARALIRWEMSRQDAAEGNTWGASRSEAIGDAMMQRAWERE